MINRLISYLYQSYDKSPHDVIALRVSHVDGFAWNVNNRILIAATEAGLVLSEIDLRSLTIRQLADSLISVGCSVTFINPDTDGRSAFTLLNGVGRESISNGDALRVYDSLLWSYLDSYGIELDDAGEQIANALSEINYSTATGEFLDFWGQYWGIPRLAGEIDATYRDRTIWEIMMPKVNPIAMSAAVYRITHRNIEMYEPWKDLFVLSESHLDREILYDGHNWSPYVYRPLLIGGDNIDWIPVLSLLEKLRPAGVIGLYPEWQSKRELLLYNGIAPELGLGRMQMNTSILALADRAILDDYHFGDSIVQNYLVNSSTVISLSNATFYRWDGRWDGYTWDEHNQEHFFGGAPDPYTIAFNHHFVRAQIVLSDMDDGFGSEQFIFPGGSTIYLNTPYLGEFALSGFDNGVLHVAFEEMIVTDIGLETTASIPLNQLNASYSSHINIQASMVSSASILTDFSRIEIVLSTVENHGWNGFWDAKNWDYETVLQLMSGTCSGIKITTSLV